MKLTSRSVLYFLAWAVYFRPEYFVLSHPGANGLYRWLNAAVSAACAAAYLYRGKISGPVLGVSGLFALQILSTALNAGELWDVVFTSVSAVSLCMFAELGLRRDPAGLVKALRAALLVYLVINTATMLLFPGGMADLTEHGRPYVWFIGYKNTFVAFFLPFICSAALCAELEGKSRGLGLFFALGLAVFSAAFAPSATAVAVIAANVIYFAFVHGRGPRVIFNAYSYYVCAGLLVFGFVVFRVQEHFSFVIVELLNRDLTLTRRTGLWDAAMGLVSRRPWIGWGLSRGSLNPHSHYLATALRSGLPGLFGFAAVLLAAATRLRRAKNNCGDILSFMLFSVMLVMLAETVHNYLLYTVLALAFNVELLDRGCGTRISR